MNQYIKDNQMDNTVQFKKKLKIFLKKVSKKDCCIKIKKNLELYDIRIVDQHYDFELSFFLFHDDQHKKFVAH